MEERDLLLKYNLQWFAKEGPGGEKTEPATAKKLKDANIVRACEGLKGGYVLIKEPEEISLFDIIASTEVTMKINRCLEEDGFCSRNATDYCSVHKAFLKVQKIYENSLQEVTIADMI